MGYIREAKNVDLVVGPTEFTKETKNSIAEAIRQYKSTGKKPEKSKIITRDSAIVVLDLAN